MISVFAFRDADGRLRVQETSNPGCPGFGPGEQYLGCFTFPGEPAQLHWGWKVVPRGLCGSILDRVRKWERKSELESRVFSRFASPSVGASAAIDAALATGEISRRQARWLRQW